MGANTEEIMVPFGLAKTKGLQGDLNTISPAVVSNHNHPHLSAM